MLYLYLIDCNSFGHILYPTLMANLPLSDSSLTSFAHLPNLTFTFSKISVTSSKKKPLGIKQPLKTPLKDLLILKRRIFIKR